MRELNQGGKIDLILTEALEIERHLHNRERWFGISADQSGNDWGLRGTLNPFVIASGIGVWGVWGKVLGSDDTPAISGMVSFDPHRILIADQDVATPFIIQLAWGSVDGDTALAAGDFSEFMVISNDAVANRAGGDPIEIKTERVPVGIKMWMRCLCATASSIDFFIGIHEYPE